MSGGERERGPRYGRWRRGTQVASTLLFLLLPFAASTGLNGTYVALRVGTVDLLEPSSALSAVVASGEVGATVLLAVALPLAIGILLGPVYCAWGCPFGLVSELVDAARQRLRRRPWPAGTAARIRSRRFLLLAVLLLASLPAGLPIVALLAPPRLLTAVPLEAYAIRAAPALTAALLACYLVLEAFGPRRIVCRVLCPQGAFAALLRRRFTLGPRFERLRCLCPGSPPCLQECPWAIDPRTMGDRDGCTTCLACVERCPSAALTVGFGSAQRVDEAASDRGGEPEEP